MLNSLRNRLILSHVLPLLLIIPLMGLALIYILESRYLLPNQARTLTEETVLLAEVTRQQTDLWNNPAYAQELLKQENSLQRTRVMFLEPDGTLLSSSSPEDRSRVGTHVDIPDFRLVASGQVVTNTDYYSPKLQADVIDVLAPVFGPDNTVIGVVRMTYQYATVYEELLQFRYLIASILVAGLLSGALVGLLLAVSISNPIRRVTQAVIDLAAGNQDLKLDERGPDEIKLLLHAVNVLVMRLNDLEAARRHLLANLVHELGRPLGALRSAIQALVNGAVEQVDLRSELLTGMDSEAERLQHLLEDLSHLHGQILGPMELDLQPVELNKWLPMILRTWQAAADEKRLHWYLDLRPDLPTIQADPVRLGQAIGNLASNAIKFTPTSGMVSISAGTEDSEIWIKVSDTGPGLTQDEKEQILMPFYRGKQGRRFPQGMGLGLSIARDLILAHGGRLEIDSTPGMGSDFTIRLPILSPELEKEE